MILINILLIISLLLIVINIFLSSILFDETTVGSTISLSDVVLSGDNGVALSSTGPDSLDVPSCENAESPVLRAELIDVPCVGIISVSISSKNNIAAS